jgi:hypothetical protein
MIRPFYLEYSPKDEKRVLAYVHQLVKDHDQIKGIYIAEDLDGDLYRDLFDVEIAMEGK